MTATIVMFPQRARDALRASEVGVLLSNALPVPTPCSELERLIENAKKALANLRDEQALDRWLAEVDEWEASGAG